MTFNQHLITCLLIARRAFPILPKGFWYGRTYCCEARVEKGSAQKRTIESSLNNEKF